MAEFPYDLTHTLAVPVCEITVEADLGRKVRLTAIIDTGADATIIPIHHLQKIGARRTLEAQIRSQWGERRTIYLYLVDLRIGEIFLPGLYVVGDELGSETILGRDALNKLYITLNGPAQLTSIAD